MDIKKYYSNSIITPLEQEIKSIKKKLNKKINLAREIDKEYLEQLQIILQNQYKKYYELDNKKNNND